MSEELKSCPFCGSEAVFQRYHTIDGSPLWYVACSKCLISSWYYPTKIEAANAWNKRDNFMRRIIRNLRNWVLRKLEK